jgi:peptidoglycan/LPS O-acetylase OafA/YrhL
MLAGMRRMVCLDGLRGVLACYVMLSHTFPFVPMPAWLHWLFQHGGAGVDVFFILSGLVIVQSLDSFDYRARPFLIARVARIYPVFLVVFAAAVAVQPLATGFERMAWIGPDSAARDIWSGGWPNDWRLFVAAHLTMTHGLFPNGVLPDVWIGFLGAAWSLSTEWQFYLLALLIAGHMRLRSLAWVFLALSAGAAGWHVTASEAWQFSRAFLPNKAQYFALGVASAIVVRQEAGGLGAYALVLTATLALSALQGGIDKLLPPILWSVCLTAQLHVSSRLQSSSPFQSSSAPHSSSLLHSSSLRKRGSRTGSAHAAFAWVPVCAGMTASVLQSRPLVWLGALSYCIYLVNEPVQKLLGVTLAIAVRGDAAWFTTLWIPGAVLLPILASWWLHERIELPAQRYGRDMALAAVSAG